MHMTLDQIIYGRFVNIANSDSCFVIFISFRYNSIVFRITYSKAATRTLRRIPANTATLIREKVTDLAYDPRKQRSNVTVLKGRNELRLRVGDWRVIYAMDGAAETIRVRLIAPRGSAYE